MAAHYDIFPYGEIFDMSSSWISTYWGIAWETGYQTGALPGDLDGDLIGVFSLVIWDLHLSGMSGS